MGLIRLGNTSEHKSFGILDRVLRDIGFTVNRQSKLDDVIKVEESALNRQEKKTLHNASFDFVVYDQESIPQFAVEFDGPCHENEQKRKSDIRKNRLCSMAGLQLLRIGNNFLTEYEKTTLLEYVVRRFVDWRKDSHEISQEESDIAEHLATIGASEEEYDRMRDPQIMWDLMHPFTASLKIAEALYSDYGIVSSHIDSEVYVKAISGPQYTIFERCNIGSHPDGLYIYREKRSYELCRVNREAPGKCHSERIHFLTVGTSYCWRLPTVDLRSADSTKPLLIFEEVHGQNLPGISMPELADHFCDFLALDKLRVWAEHNLHDSLR
jgi:very-short-patch-repair endonuclease